MAHAEGPADILVGREEERAGLWAALDNAISGQGRLVLLAGEPGIGKTRLAEDLASHATGLGVPVLWGRCYEEEGAPPYWPWIQPLRTYIEQTDVDRLQVEIGRGAAIIGEIVPEILDKLPGVGTTLELTPERARFRLFESVTNYLKKAAQPQALLLVLDDLQWADKPSLLLLQFLAQTLSDSRMLVVGTYRDVDLTRDHPLSDSLALLSREAAFERHILRGLTHQESGHLVDVATGRQTPSNLVDSIYAQTEGNPFFIGEIVRLLAEQIRNETPPDPGPLGAPEELGFSELRIPEGVRNSHSTPATAGATA